jgi:RNA polymerase sigma factor (sigma-70 family)
MNDMHAKSDAQLLRQYAEQGTEAAFVEIVNRHTNLVHSAALRQVDSPQIAAEVTQDVFVGLAQAARFLSRQLAEDASLVGWLCRSARNASLNLRRNKIRRRSHTSLEMAGFYPNVKPTDDWERLRPVLDDAMSVLSETDESDHDALVMRIFKNQDLPSVSRALGVSDDTAQTRISRALDKLRARLIRLGITTDAAALSVVLSAKAVQAAPVGLAVTISTVAAIARTSLSA